MHHSPRHLPSLQVKRRSWLYVLLAGILFYIVLPQLRSFRLSLHLLTSVRASWLAVALLASLGIYFGAASKYQALAFKPLTYSRTLLVQVASSLANRLLPAGIGALGINYAYLRRAQHTKIQAAVVVSVNNLLGLVVHMLLVGAFIIYGWQTGKRLFPAWHVSQAWTEAGLVGLVLLAGCLLVFRKSWQKSLEGAVREVLSFGSRPLDLGKAVLSSAAITLMHVICLWSCAQALGVPLAFTAAFVVLSVGVATASVSPTPGGLIGAEAGLVASLVAYKVPAAQALAITLLYRLLTYWLTLVFGVGALALAERKGLL